MRPAEINRGANMYYVDDIDHLDDQIDRDGQDEPSSMMTFDDWLRSIEEDRAPAQIEDYTKLTRWAKGRVDFLPDTITAFCRAEFLTYHVSKLYFEGMSFDDISLDDFVDIVLRDMPEILLKQKVFDFIEQLPESVRDAVEEYELMALVENRFQAGISTQEVHQVVNRMAERRGFIADPDQLKKQRRIRRRKITRAEPKQIPDL